MYSLYIKASFILSLTLLIVSCVSVPTETQLINEHGKTGTLHSSSECNVEQYFDSLSNNEPAIQLNPEDISILNWNIYKTSKNNWAEDFTSLIETKDVLILQEAIASPEVKELLKKRHSNWQLNTAFHYDNYEVGVLTASKIKPLFSCGIRTTEPVIRLPKTILINLYPLEHTDEKLLVANLHGINFTLGTKAYEKQISSMVNIIQNHNGPIIIAGDFNTWSDQRIEIVNVMASKLSLMSVKYNVQNRTKVFGHALDHVYYKGLEVIEEKTLNVTSSDHNPISVNFRKLDQITSL